MPVKDHVCEMSVKRLHEAKEQNCKYSFLRYLDDLKERLEILDDNELWKAYGEFLQLKL